MTKKEKSASAQADSRHVTCRKFKDLIHEVKFIIPPERYLIVDETYLTAIPKIKEHCFSPWPIQLLVGGGVRWTEQRREEPTKTRSVCMLPLIDNMNEYAHLVFSKHPFEITQYLQDFELRVECLVAFDKGVTVHKFLEARVWFNEFNMPEPFSRACLTDCNTKEEATTFLWNRKESVRTFIYRLGRPLNSLSDCGSSRKRAV